jgi:hypothetical protein
MSHVCHQKLLSGQAICVCVATKLNRNVFISVNVSPTIFFASVPSTYICHSGDKNEPIRGCISEGNLTTSPPTKKWKKPLDTCRYVDPVCLGCRGWEEDVEYKSKGKEIPLQAWTALRDSEC